VVARRGASTLGCLLPLLLAAVVVYLGHGVVEAYFHNYQFADSMVQESRFSSNVSDDVITSHFRALADSLGLPRSAGMIRISRASGGVTIWSDYDVTIEFPFNHEKTLHFHPSSESSF
jgi:hypothetical protein